ncbi:site-specific integrase [Bacillus pretiosus]|uniref:site-specific integrase n=1 Tax=Bacillus pretiosus TaxID=2983392 RepID=UPI003D65FE57
MLDKIFTWIPKSVSIEKRFKEKIITEDCVIICIRNNITQSILPHPLADFIFKVYRNQGLSYNSQLKAARVICSFFNFINICIEDEMEEFQSLRKDGIAGLNLLHACEFITHVTYKGVSYRTSQYYERVLTKFYKYLKDKNLVTATYDITYKQIRRGKQIELILISPFSQSKIEVERPNRMMNNERLKLKDFGENRYRLVYEFIEEAEKSDIALGVCFQFLAGLRIGEVVNLTKESIYENGLRGNGGFWIVVEDNQKKLFSHLRNKGDVQVKRPREVFVLSDKKLEEIYYEHLKRLNHLEKIKGIKNEHALFVSRKSGLPLSGANYAMKFAQVKERFLERLRINRRYKDLEFLESLPWSTHIGRGTYTNFLIDIGLSIGEIANLRGDKTLNATLRYIERRTALQKVQRTIENLSKLEEISEPTEISGDYERKRELYNVHLTDWRGIDDQR